MDFPLKPTEDRNVARHLATTRQNLNNGWGSHTFFGTPRGGNSQLTFDSYALYDNNTPNYYPDDFNVYSGTLRNNKRGPKRVRFDDFTDEKRSSFGKRGSARKYGYGKKLLSGGKNRERKSFGKVSYSNERAQKLNEMRSRLMKMEKFTPKEVEEFSRLSGDPFGYDNYIKKLAEYYYKDPVDRNNYYREYQIANPLLERAKPLSPTRPQF